MDLITIIFYFFAVLIVASAAVVVFSKNIMYSAFALLFTFFGVATIYVLLTTRITGVDIKSGLMGKMQIGITGIALAILTITMGVMYSNVKWFVRDSEPLKDTISPIGRMLLTDYLLAFEAASVLLLIAIIGAAMIARRKK